MSDIPICVLTCDKYLWMLRPFALLFNTFWGHEQEVRVFGYTRICEYVEDLPPNFKFISHVGDPYPVGKWSNGLIEVVGTIEEKWFILFLEDFWLVNPVKLDVVDELIRYVQQNENILRMDLSNERMSKKNARVIETVNGVGIVNAPLPSQYSMSFQVGIWNRDLMLRVLKHGETPWQAEIDGTKRVNELKKIIRVYGSNKRPVDYQPVYRNRKNSLSLDRIPIQLINVMKRKGWFDGQG